MDNKHFNYLLNRGVKIALRKDIDEQGDIYLGECVGLYGAKTYARSLDELLERLVEVYELCLEIEDYKYPFHGGMLYEEVSY